MATGADVLRVAAREIGYREQPGKRTKYGEWYGLQGEPWCMEFVQWVYHEAGSDLPFRTASCGSLLRWYTEQQPDCIREKPVPGCIVIFDLPGTQSTTDHTGIFVRLADGKITTIDGNTSNENEGNGGWVQQRTRRVADVKPVYIVPRELKEETEVQRYDNVSEIRIAAPWAAPTVEKLCRAGALNGKSGWYDGDGYPTGLDLSEDMLRLLVISDNAGAFRNIQKPDTKIDTQIQ